MPAEIVLNIVHIGIYRKNFQKVKHHSDPMSMQYLMD